MPLGEIIMTTKIIKVIISACLSLGAVILYLTLGGEERKKCMIGMIACTLGDIFMVDLFRIGDVSTYPGAGLFMLGHVIYALGFIKATKRKGYKYFNKGFKFGLGLTLFSAVLLGILAFTIPEVPQTIMYFLILVYVAVIGFNLVSQFSYASNEKGGRYWLIAAMFLFLLSDFVIFLSMLDVTVEHNFIVWATYIPAQLLIILFNTDLNKDKKI